jgi:hypothetical protein
VEIFALLGGVMAPRGKKFSLFALRPIVYALFTFCSHGEPILIVTIGPESISGDNPWRRQPRFQALCSTKN